MAFSEHSLVCDIVISTQGIKEAADAEQKQEEKEEEKEEEEAAVTNGEQKSPTQTAGSPKEEVVLTQTVETITNGEKVAPKPAKSKAAVEVKEAKPTPKEAAKTSAPASTAPASKEVKEK